MSLHEYCQTRVLATGLANYLFSSLKILCGLLLLLTIGCTSSIKRDALQSVGSLPAAWAGIQTTNTIAVSHWLKTFNNADISALVHTALQQNPDLKAAAARVDMAQEQARIAGANLYPQLFLNGGYLRQTPTSQYPSNQEFIALFNLSWELDVWGRIKASHESAALDAEAALSDFEAARLSIAARVAMSYFDLIEARLQTEVASESIKDRSIIVELIRGRYAKGLSSALDLRLVLTDLANAKARLAEARNQLQLVAHRLQVLLGQYPDGGIHYQSSLPEPPAILAAGLPSQLLERRPDLKAAMARLRSADAGLVSSKKALLPRITLTADGGTTSAALSAIIDPRTAAWNLAIGLLQPVFIGGRLTATIRLNEAHTIEALNNYRMIALTAFREVEQSLAAEALLREKESALKTAVEQTRASRRLAVISYRQGLIDILTLLDSYRSTLNTQSDFLLVRRQLLDNRINLYLALGGAV